MFNGNEIQNVLKLKLASVLMVVNFVPLQFTDHDPCIVSGIVVHFLLCEQTQTAFQIAPYFLYRALLVTRTLWVMVKSRAL